ncbi:hypothetical protein PHMEG_00019238 [Phytophthora megakarya]|uniref:Uncharacterized protein n=1 Tax=Phytophthora megakarya TaxID=4795 RepID=A0A225VRT5_9STRA|nr:hypothetical protein PHMEG_00019238 [Phytophthora megakarya]
MDVDDDIVPMGDTLQLRDGEIMEAQKQSRFVKKLLELGVHQGMQIETREDKERVEGGAATNLVISAV